MRNSFSLNDLVRKNVLELSPYSSARDEFKSDGKEMVFLDANENPFDNGLNRYPDPQQKELKAVLAAQKDISTKQILLGNGSDEVLDLIFRVFCEPGIDNIITLPPTYGMYKVLARINNIEEREVLLDEEFQPRLKKILDAVDSKTRIIFLCSPNNPSGNSFAEDQVVKILESFNGLVVIDEAYIDFSEKQSWLRKLSDFPNLIITQTLSKAYGLAGIRLGIAYASEEIIALLNKIKPPYNINLLTQRSALEAIKRTEVVQKEIKEILDQRMLLEKELPKINFVLKVYPSDANFILLKVDDAPRRYSELIERGIVIRDRSSQQLCENCLRFTIGTTEENLKLMDALKQMQTSDS